MGAEQFYDNKHANLRWLTTRHRDCVEVISESSYFDDSNDIPIHFIDVRYVFEQYKNRSYVRAYVIF